jgi:hypothetical protein
MGEKSLEAARRDFSHFFYMKSALRLQYGLRDAVSLNCMK